MPGNYENAAFSLACITCLIAIIIRFFSHYAPCCTTSCIILVDDILALNDCSRTWLYVNTGQCTLWFRHCHLFKLTLTLQQTLSRGWSWDGWVEWFCQQNFAKAKLLFLFNEIIILLGGLIYFLLGKGVYLG